MSPAGDPKSLNTGSRGKGAGMPRTLGLLVRGKNINQNTLLATDYLNHFNELVMLLELLPQMPECLEDALQWRPKTYQEHFRDSAFADKELAILAYDSSPDRYRLRLEETVAKINEAVAVGLPEIEAAMTGAHDEPVDVAVGRVLAEVKAHLALANDIIHGTARSMDQRAIDELWGQYT